MKNIYKFFVHAHPVQIVQVRSNNRISKALKNSVYVSFRKHESIEKTIFFHVKF